MGDYVRLRSAYVIRADDVVRNEEGEIVEIIASYVPGTVGENPPEGIRPRGVIHWVSATNSVDCDLRLYDNLFTTAAPDAGEGSFLDHINPNSLTVVENCRAEVGLANVVAGESYQFEREGYFCLDSGESDSGRLVFNRTIALR